ncbi:hypothetical protein HMPREF1155_1443 [Slackia sp. CM382]|nr:hypothetical protein HMPREF1155_1443 [Slackia sp. CM382]
MRRRSCKRIGHPLGGRHEFRRLVRSTYYPGSATSLTDGLVLGRIAVENATIA